MESPFNDDLSKIADSMGVTLYQRFTPAEAALFLRCPVRDVNQLQKQGRIDSIILPNSKFEFFGYQLLQYILSSTTHRNTAIIQPPTQSPDRIIRAKEVQNMTGLSRTTLWRFEKNGKFPARVGLGASSVGWKLSEVQAWIEEKW